ncbi:hypothetical protein H7F50_06300 [Novosphingobium flavum]|uniref:hypothetical protein n=1 Tax=Novosphingobium aerophilum TaxID=2839843 RepID=UPI00163ACDB1|nr:hypothetical protein [Novosphingobium aerophilum]MBC2661360.1 hypothetical protein [Novosphingobium aerophilum]
MNLRSLLESRSAGEILSAAAALVLLLLVEVVLSIGLWRSLATRSDVGLNQLGLMIGCGMGIGALVRFLRKRHGSR